MFRYCGDTPGKVKFNSDPAGGNKLSRALQPVQIEI